MTDSELNALVAEKVMGLKNIRSYTGHEYLSREHICDEGVGAGFIYDRYYSDHGYEVCNVPDYCNDIAAAWSVVDKMESLYYECEVYQGSAFCERQVKFWKSDNQGDSLSYATSESLPRAICLAALKAVGVDISHVG